MISPKKMKGTACSACQSRIRESGKAGHTASASREKPTKPHPRAGKTGHPASARRQRAGTNGKAQFTAEYTAAPKAEFAADFNQNPEPNSGAIYIAMQNASIAAHLLC